MAEQITILDIDESNVAEAGVYCIKNKKSPGYKAKVKWFQSEINRGLKIKIAVNDEGKQLGFIEYLPSEIAWKPIAAKNYLFIQCIALFVKDAHGKGIGSQLIEQCESDAKAQNKNGICVMSSKGVWMPDTRLFEKNGFTKADELERFELMAKPFGNASAPQFNNWTENREQYQGWNLVYAQQCPFHEKSVNDLIKVAKEFKIDLKVTEFATPQQAQKAPSGFGTFTLIKDGKLLEDHCISGTRFKNIIRANS